MSERFPNVLRNTSACSNAFALVRPAWVGDGGNDPCQFRFNTENSTFSKRSDPSPDCIEKFKKSAFIGRNPQL